MQCFSEYPFYLVPPFGSYVKYGNRADPFHPFCSGYDVWMINNRGTPYSRNHTTFCSTCAEFWDFGWHESAIGDYPVTIDYVLNQTQQQSLYIICHSMGCTQYLVNGFICVRAPMPLSTFSPTEPVYDKDISAEI